MSELVNGQRPAEGNTELKQQAKAIFTDMAGLILANIDSGLENQFVPVSGINDLIDFRIAWRLMLIEKAEAIINRQYPPNQQAIIDKQISVYLGRPAMYKSGELPAVIASRQANGELTAMKRTEDGLVTAVNVICAFTNGAKQLGPNLSSEERFQILTHPQTTNVEVALASLKIDEFSYLEQQIFNIDDTGVINGLNLAYFQLKDGHIAVVDRFKPLLRKYNLGEAAHNLASAHSSPNISYDTDLGVCPIVHKTVLPHFDNLVALMAADAYTFGLLE